MKPIELIERALQNSSKRGDLVADFFAGAGSALIGSERLGRKSRLMEIELKYCDCIVVRWQQYTGKQAVLEGDGRSYEQVAKERRLAAA
jgi:DNA modification methylase